MYHFLNSKYTFTISLDILKVPRPWATNTYPLFNGTKPSKLLT